MRSDLCRSPLVFITVQMLLYQQMNFIQINKDLIIDFIHRRGANLILRPISIFFFIFFIV